VQSVAGISAENCLGGFLIIEKSVKSVEFVQIMNEFNKNGREYTMFGDNATWHKGSVCRAAYL
jgi:hypothetical protein